MLVKLIILREIEKNNIRAIAQYRGNELSHYTNSYVKENIHYSEVINEPDFLKNNSFLFRNMADPAERFWISHFKPHYNILGKKKVQNNKKASIRTKVPTEKIKRRRRKKNTNEPPSNWTKVNNGRVIITDVTQSFAYSMA